MSLGCPRCDAPLHARPIGDIEIDECRSCQGLFLERSVVDRVIADREHARAERLLAALPTEMASPIVKPGQRMYIKCPVCQNLMNRKLFASGAGVIIDVCKAHGTFFDAGELPAIVAFVRKGGLEKAAKVNQAEAERRRRQQAAERVAVSALPGDTTDAVDVADAGVALVDLLFALFG